MLKIKYPSKTTKMEAMDYRVNLRDHYPMKSVKFKIPIEMWSSIKPSINHLKVR